MKDKVKRQLTGWVPTLESRNKTVKGSEEIQKGNIGIKDLEYSFFPKTLKIGPEKGGAVSGNSSEGRHNCV